MSHPDYTLYTKTPTVMVLDNRGQTVRDIHYHRHPNTQPPISVSPAISSTPLGNGFRVLTHVCLSYSRQTRRLNPISPIFTH